MAKVLIADDDAHIVRVMSIWLARHGHRVFTAPNGRKALQIITGGSIDLVISDMNMPDVDGLSLAKAIRSSADARTAGLPVIMLSARCDQGALTNKLAGLAVQLFPKPFLPSQLVEEIDRLLGLPAAAQEKG